MWVHSAPEGRSGAEIGMLVVETIAKSRRAYFVQKKAIKEICRELRVSRKTVRRVVRSGATEFVYERKVQPQPKIVPWREEFDRLLAVNAARSSRERLTLIRILRGAARSWLQRRVRRGAPICGRLAAGARRGDGGGLRAAELFAGRGLPVRLEPRGGADRRGHGDGEGGAGPALPQPDAVRAGLPA